MISSGLLPACHSSASKSGVSSVLLLVKGSSIHTAASIAYCSLCASLCDAPAMRHLKASILRDVLHAEPCHQPLSPGSQGITMEGQGKVDLKICFETETAGQQGRSQQIAFMRKQRALLESTREPVPEVTGLTSWGSKVPPPMLSAWLMLTRHTGMLHKCFSCTPALWAIKLIRRGALQAPTWGALRIHGQLGSVIARH